MPKRVLIVEADDFSSRALERMLTMYEYDIDAVDDAEIAVAVLPYARPDLVVASYPPHVLGGAAFVAHVRRIVPHARLLALVPRDAQWAAEGARRDGFSDVVSKPVIPDHLSRALRLTIGPPDPWPLSEDH